MKNGIPSSDEFSQITESKSKGEMVVRMLNLLDIDSAESMLNDTWAVELRVSENAARGFLEKFFVENDMSLDLRQYPHDPRLFVAKKCKGKRSESKQQWLDAKNGVYLRNLGGVVKVQSSGLEKLLESEVLEMGGVKGIVGGTRYRVEAISDLALIAKISQGSKNNPRRKLIED